LRNIKVVFSRTLDSVHGNARLAEASVAEEAAAALDATDKDVSIGGAGLAAAAIELGLVDELRWGSRTTVPRTRPGARRRAATDPSPTSEELFRFHVAQVRELDGYLCGRRLYETMGGGPPERALAVGMKPSTDTLIE